MPRFGHLTNAFNAGELSPHIYGRTDLDKYAAGAARIENFIVYAEGGVHRRMGTKFVATLKDQSKRSRLVPFVFSTEQAYALEFADGLIRVFVNEGLTDSPTHTFVPGDVGATPDEIAETDHGYYHEQGPVRLTTTVADLPDPLLIDTDYYVLCPQANSFPYTAATFATNKITITGHGYSDEMGPFRLTTTGVVPAGLVAKSQDYYIIYTDADTVQLETSVGAGVSGFTDQGSGTHTLTPTPAYSRDKYRLSETAGGAAVDITDGGTGTHTVTPTPVAPATTVPLEIESPYLEDELSAIQFAQSADVLYLVHPDHPIRTLSRVSHVGWRLEEWEPEDGPYLPENVTDTTFNPSALTGVASVTASSIEGINGGVGFLARDIGRSLRWKQGGAWGWGYIVGVESTVKCWVLVEEDFTAGGFSAAWRLSAWWPENRPSSISFFEQRLAFGGEPQTPETIHASQTGKYNNFGPTDFDGTVNEDNSLDFTIGNNQVTAILWMASLRNLVVGTKGGVHVLQASTDNEAVTPFSVNLAQASPIGVKALQPRPVSNRLAYVSRSGQRVKVVRFDAAEGMWTTEDLTLLANHITGFGHLDVDAYDYQGEPTSIGWLLRSDGQLAASTFVPEQSVFAWHRHTVGGSFGDGDAVVESIAVIPSPDEDHDQLWMIVKRTIDGSTVRYVEFLEQQWENEDLEDAFYVDAGYTHSSGTPWDTLPGLTWLEGETVQILADGAVQPDQVVTGGTITLSPSACKVQVGLGFVSDLETLDLYVPDRGGLAGSAAISRTARIDHVTLRFHDTVGGKVGPTTDELDPLSLRHPDDPMDGPPSVFRGDYRFTFTGRYERTRRVIVRQDQPLPMNLLALQADGSQAEK